jgi:hypothetical protein
MTTTNVRSDRCDRCDRTAQFRFASGGAKPALRCWLHAVVYPPVFRRALQVAAVVGTTLFVINQLDVVLSGKIMPLVVVKILLTYMVPFLVSTYSALEINRLHRMEAVAGQTPSAPPTASTPGAAA